MPICRRSRETYRIHPDAWAQKARSAMKIKYTIAVFYISSFTFPRFSILYLYLEMFSASRRTRIVYLPPHWRCGCHLNQWDTDLALAMHFNRCCVEHNVPCPLDWAHQDVSILQHLNNHYRCCDDSFTNSYDLDSKYDQENYDQCHLHFPPQKEVSKVSVIF